jgi:hypothetical protein
LVASVGKTAGLGKPFGELAVVEKRLGLMQVPANADDDLDLHFLVAIDRLGGALQIVGNRPIQLCIECLKAHYA